MFESSLSILFFVVVVILGMYLYMKKNKSINIEDISSEKEKYETKKWIVEDAIEKNDIEKIKRLLSNENITEYDDLNQMMKQALKNR